MTTINGNPVSDHYGSINDLPKLIEALDHDLTARPDGNYTEDELGWLHQFHSLCGDQHHINAIDRAQADILGPRAFRELTPRQKSDLILYLSSSFPNYTKQPTLEALPQKTPENTLQFPNASEPSAAPEQLSDEGFQDLILTAQETFIRDVLKENGSDFYLEFVFPYLDGLPTINQQEIYAALLDIPADLPQVQKWQQMEKVCRRYDLPFSFSYSEEAKLFFKGCWAPTCQDKKDPPE